MPKTYLNEQTREGVGTFIEALANIAMGAKPGEGVAFAVGVTKEDEGPWLITIEAHSPCEGGIHENCTVVGAMNRDAHEDYELSLKEAEGTSELIAGLFNTTMSKIESIELPDEQKN